MKLLLKRHPGSLIFADRSLISMQYTDIEEVGVNGLMLMMSLLTFMTLMILIMIFMTILTMILMMILMMTLKMTLMTVGAGTCILSKFPAAVQK